MDHMDDKLRVRPIAQKIKFTNTDLQMKPVYRVFCDLLP